MKNVILMALLCMGFFSAQAQNEFTIQGKVKGLKDGGNTLSYGRECGE